MHLSRFVLPVSFALLSSCTANLNSTISPQAQAVCDEIYSISPSRLAYAPSSSKATLNSPELTGLYMNTTTTYWD